MYALNEAQYETEAKSFFRQVFSSEDPFGEPFSNKIAERVILYPCYSHLKPPLLDALIAALLETGDPGLYMKQLWSPEGRPEHCFIPVSELHEGYMSSYESGKLIEVRLNMLLLHEYILYSSQGKWGLIASHEDHAILGGSKEFVEIICSKIPDVHQQVYTWLDDIKEEDTHKRERGLARGTLNWLPILLAHVYGEQQSIEMLNETGLSYVLLDSSI